jgi:MOSC domain-containing protein YiiM
MEGDDGVSRSVRARKKAIETQWLARVLETGQVREDAALSFSVQYESTSLQAIFSANYPPDADVLQGGAERLPPRGDVSPFRAA